MEMKCKDVEYYMCSDVETAFETEMLVLFKKRIRMISWKVIDYEVDGVKPRDRLEVA